jgi:hypothetical protein
VASIVQITSGALSASAPDSASCLVSAAVRLATFASSCVFCSVTHRIRASQLGVAASQLALRIGKFVVEPGQVVEEIFIVHHAAHSLSAPFCDSREHVEGRIQPVVATP